MPRKLLPAASFICLLLSACQHRIVLKGLYRAMPASLPAFRLEQSTPYEAAGAVRPQYVLTEADQIELTWKEPARSDHRIQANPAQENPDWSKACPGSGVPATGRILMIGFHPRIPLAVLGRVNQLEIVDPDAASNYPPINLCGQDHQFLLDPARHPRWQDVVEVFRDAPVAITLIHEPARWAFPGDEVRITLQWQFLSSDTADTYSAAEIVSQVDRRGKLFVPGLSSPAWPFLKFDDAAYKKSGLMREWRGEIDRHAFEIEAWIPNRPLDNQMSLQRLGACLSALWSRGDRDRSPNASMADQKPPSLALEVQSCFAHGVEDGIYWDTPAPNTGVGSRLGDNNHQVRYRLEPNQFWTFVGIDGKTFRFSYIPGETLQQGVTRAFRELLGKEVSLGEDDTDEDLFIVVVPRHEFAPGKESDPFWTRVRRRERSHVGTILIAPGDFVHITGRQPKPWRPTTQ